MKKGYITTIILLFISTIFLLPFLWMILSAVDAHATLNIKLPTFTFDNFMQVLSNPNNLRSLLNGAFIALFTGAGVVTLSLLAAYPLSRYKLKSKKKFLYGLLMLTGMPGIAITIPLYQLFFRLGLLNSRFWIVVLLTSGGIPYGVWLMKNFIDAIPVELEESAWTDGATRMEGIRKVLVPVLTPGIITIFIFNFSAAWGNFFTPFIFLNDPTKFPVSVTIFQFFGQYGSVEYGKLAAFSFLYTVPSILLYFFAQKIMSSGMKMGGSMKG